MNIKKLENRSLRYVLLHPGNAFDLCFEIVKRHGLARAISGRPVSQFEAIDIQLEDPLGILEYFQRGGQISLSTLELLSMAYLVTYYQHHDTTVKEYMIGVDIEDRRKGQTERELYLSDGLLAIRNGDEETITPFQQVIAQNIIGKNTKNSIQNEIVQQANNKIARRSDYNDISGLIISVLPGSATLNLAEVLDMCDMEAFLPTFLMIYHDGLTTCTVHHLDNSISSIQDLKSRVFEITPRLVRENNNVV